MNSIKEIINRLETLKCRIKQVPDKVSTIAKNNQDVLISLNKDQMLLGRNVDGVKFTPSYLDDPYFKSTESAKSYAAMKYHLETNHKARIENPTLYPDKDRNTPNLIVTGPFQDGMFINMRSDSFLIGSSYRDSDDIERKYNNLVFGLSPESKEYFYKTHLHPALKKLLEKEIK